MLSAPKLDNFSARFDWTDAAYAGFAVKLPVKIEIALKNIQHACCLKGTYTPNNDYLYLKQNMSDDQLPNFMVLLCSAQLNLTLSSQVSFLVSSLPVFKLWHLFMPSTQTYPIKNIYLEGRTNMPMPMPQGVAVDYMFISGQAEID